MMSKAGMLHPEPGKAQIDGAFLSILTAPETVFGTPAPLTAQQVTTVPRFSAV